MVVQVRCHIVNCPICGRPVELQAEYLGCDLVCEHCRGQFVVYDRCGELTVTRMDGTDSLERAEQLLEYSARPTADRSWRRSAQLPSSRAACENDRNESGIDISPRAEARTNRKRPIVVLVEDRDEVFVRVSGDLARAGMRVIRAESAFDAMGICVKCNPVLVVASVNLPDQSGWLLAGKLWFIDRGIRVWLYQPSTSGYDAGMAGYVQVDELLDYGGQLHRLSQLIRERLTSSGERVGVSATLPPRTYVRRAS